MDYASSLNDADPVEASPWGSNSPTHSPKPSRTSFGGSFTTPDSPNMTSENQDLRDSYTSETGAGSGSSERPGQSSNGSYEQQRPSTAESDIEQQGHQGLHQHESQYQPQQSYQHNENQPPQDASRQQSYTRPASRPGPHYKLVAKITGLERTGRKDPILRFDVHVSSCFRKSPHYI